MIFIDSCILIDYINGKLSIEEDKSNLYINSIVENELIIGSRDKKDLATINKKISLFPLLDIDQDIMDLSTKLLLKYKLSHNMSIYDAIIASSCMIYDLPLWTLNKKDFKFLDIKLV